MAHRWPAGANGLGKSASVNYNSHSVPEGNVGGTSVTRICLGDTRRGEPAVDQVALCCCFCRVRGRPSEAKTCWEGLAFRCALFWWLCGLHCCSRHQSFKDVSIKLSLKYHSCVVWPGCHLDGQLQHQWRPLKKSDFLFVCFRRGFHVAQATLLCKMRITLLLPPHRVITSHLCCAKEWNSGLCACWLSTLPTELRSPVPWQ